MKLRKDKYAALEKEWSDLHKLRAEKRKEVDAITEKMTAIMKRINEA